MPQVGNVASLDGALLERVQKRVVAQLPQRTLMLQLVEKSVAKTMGQGKQYVKVLKTQFGESYRAMREHEGLPQSSVGKHERVIMATKIIASTFDFTALAEAVTDGTDSSLVDAVEDGTKDLKSAFRRNWSRSMYLLGDGAIAVVESVDVANKQITVKTPSLTNRWATAYIRPGMRLSASANVTATDFNAEKGLDAEVLDVNPTTRVITLDTLVAGDTAANDFLFVGGPLETSKSREYQGLLAGLDDGTLKGTYLTKSRAGTGGYVWQATVVSGGSQNIERLLILYATTVNNRSDDMFDVLISQPGVYNAYAMPFLANRVNPGTGPMEMVGGFGKIKIQLEGKVIDWYLDPDAPYGCLFGMNKKAWERVEVRAPGFWIGADGKPVRSTNALMSRLAFWGAGDFVTERPNVGLRIDGIVQMPA